jgi:multicomponent Na+:H+ antiporter subunit C
VTTYAYGVAGWLMLVGCFGIVRARDLVAAVVSLTVTQAGSYVLLLTIGYQSGALAPILGPAGVGVPPAAVPVVDPVVQAMTLTDVVVSATVTALLLALVIQVAKRHGTVDPDELRALRG